MKKKAETLPTRMQNRKLQRTFVEDRWEMLKEKIQPNHRVMVAISGGPDSMLTAYLMYGRFIRQGYDTGNLFFLHCNHKVRPGNTEDEQFIRSHFEGTQLIVCTRTGKGKTSEEELRKWRYLEFNKRTATYGIDRLTFGHNLTDRIETTFLNLLRGAKLNGFIAMQQEGNHHLLPGVKVIRPILEMTKAEVMHICKEHKIPYRKDPTNTEATTSMRNKLRNKVLPPLYKLSHKQTATTNTFIESMKHIYRQIDEGMITQENTLHPIDAPYQRKSRFAYQWMIDAQEVWNEAVMQMMKKLNIANNITTPLLDERTTFIRNNESGYKYFNKTYLFKSHGNIYIIWAPERFRKATVTKPIKIDTLGTIDREGTSYEIAKKEYLGAILRFPKAWDRYKNKTRNQWCINQKIPVFMRNFIPIIVKGKKIMHMFKPKKR